jgi:hypothetical protein
MPNPAPASQQPNFDSRGIGEQVLSPELEIAISEAGNFDELFEAIRSQKGLQEAEKFYDAEELVGMINQVRTGQLSLDTVPPAGGLRKRVAYLMEIDKLRKKIEAEWIEKSEVLRQLDGFFVPLTETMQQMLDRDTVTQAARFANFVNVVQLLALFGLTKEEAQRVLSSIESFPAGARNPEDLERLEQVLRTIKRKAR